MAKSTRNTIATKSYLLESGEEVKSIQPGVVALLFKFANGESRTVDASQASQEINGMACYFGFAQTLGDSYAGSGDIGEAIEKFDERYEALFERGEWTKGSDSSGPQSGIVAEALKRLSDRGTIPGDKYADLAVATEEVRSWDKETRAKKVAVKALAEEIAAIKIERAQERLAKMRAAEGTDAEEVAAL